MTDSEAVAVFGSSQTIPGSSEWVDAREVGESLAAAGYAVVTGGYGGTMEAVSKGAAEAGGHVIGVTTPKLFPHRPGANQYVAEEVEADVLTDRLGLLIEGAVGAIALPGSIGTATELLIAWNHNHIVRSNGGSPIPTVAIGPEWATIVRALVSEVRAFPGDIHLSETATEGVSWLLERLKIR